MHFRKGPELLHCCHGVAPLLGTVGLPTAFSSAALVLLFDVVCHRPVSGIQEGEPSDMVGGSVWS